jgi:hypothetical protein
MIVTVMIASDAQQSAQRRFQQASCIAETLWKNQPLKMRTYDPTKIDFDATGCPGDLAPRA